MELQASLDRRLAEWADYNAKVGCAGDWTQGASRALHLSGAGGQRGRHDGVFSQTAFNGMADSIANLPRPEVQFPDFDGSIPADPAKWRARIAASKLPRFSTGYVRLGASAGGSTPSGA